MTHIAAIANNKGGVGKTEVTTQLAAALARRGLGVLVVDMDPQANASRRLGCEWNPASPTATMSEVLAAEQAGAGEGAVVSCGWLDDDGSPTAEGALIDVLPARFDLINRETEAGQVGAVRRLKRALEGWTEDYDVILIDTRPDLGHLVQMAMTAASTVIIPTDAAYDSIEAAIRVSDFIARHADDIGNPGLTVGGVVVTRWDHRKAEQEYQIAGARERFGNLVWRLGGLIGDGNGGEILLPLYIPEWTRFAEADSAAVSLSEWNDRRGRETRGLFDAVARHYIDRFIGTTSRSAA